MLIFWLIMRILIKKEDDSRFGIIDKYEEIEKEEEEYD